MLSQTTPYNAPRLVRLLTGLGFLLVMMVALSCDKMPLVAPTGSVITLFPNATSVPSNGSMQIVATVIEQGVAAAPPSTGGGTTTTPPTTTTTTSSSSAGAGTPVQNGTLISFTTTIGRIEPREARTTNGQATVTYYADGQSGTATITAFSGGASGKLEGLKVGTAAAERLRVSAAPQNLSSRGGTAEVQARVEDASGNPLPGVQVTFAADFGSLSASTVATDANGIAATRLTTSQKSTVTVRAGAQEATLIIGLADRTGIALTPPATPPTAGQPTNIQVAVSPTANVQDVILEFGDNSRTNLGRLAGSTTVSHTYNNDGSYVVTGTAVAADGTRESVSTSITVLPQRPLAVNLTASPRCAVRGVTTVTFTAVASGGTPVLYTWDLGDGTTRTTTGPTTDHVYSATTTPGPLTVTVRVRALDAGEGLAQTTITIASPGGCS